VRKVSISTLNVKQTRVDQPSPLTDGGQDSQHPLGLSILLHLLPGVGLLLVPLLIMPLVRYWGYPPIFAGSLSILVVLLPWEIGYLLFLGRQRNGHWSLAGIVRYQEPMPLWQYLLFVPLLVFWFFTATSMWNQLLPTITTSLKWLPAWVVDPLPFGETGTYSASILLTSALFRLVCSGLIAPVGEELYFRGYLLPRIDRLGYWAPLLNVVLFASQHYWTLLANPGRVIALFPLVFVVWWKRNIRVGMIVHLILNVVAVILPLLALLS
jgi:membrane protease YdiL (CAAX protease family)